MSAPAAVKVCRFRKGWVKVRRSRKGRVKVFRSGKGWVKVRRSGKGWVKVLPFRKCPVKVSTCAGAGILRRMDATPFTVSNSAATIAQSARRVIFRCLA
jgi:hypothetical protein